MSQYNHKDLKLAIIGLGYVGLPLALEFSKKRKVIGYDINKKRINDLKEGKDINLEFSKEEILENKKISFTFENDNLKNCSCYIITVPTPVKKNKKPDLTPLKNASKQVAKYLKKNDIIIYESTVYPGATEEICVPILEKYSKLKFNKEFYCGYSPERINPGDKYRKISDIKKITSGSLPKISKLVDKLYKSIIKAGTHVVSSIKTAEAAKIIENTQRDLNIAFINELSILFRKMNLDTEEVLKAAETKWNFISFRPGLVGGHCIGVDPYYLTYKSKSLGYKPKVILAGRKINDSMPMYIVEQIKNLSKNKSLNIDYSRILILGLTFKENCSDIRNSLVFDIIKKLKKFKCTIDVYDPLIDHKNIKIRNFNLVNNIFKFKYDIIIVAVAHNVFKKISSKDLKKICKRKNLIIDLKNFYNKNFSDFRL